MVKETTGPLSQPSDTELKARLKTHPAAHAPDSDPFGRPKDKLPHTLEGNGDDNTINTHWSRQKGFVLMVKGPWACAAVAFVAIAVLILVYLWRTKP